MRIELRAALLLSAAYLALVCELSCGDSARNSSNQPSAVEVAGRSSSSDGGSNLASSEAGAWASSRAGDASHGGSGACVACSPGPVAGSGGDGLGGTVVAVAGSAGLASEAGSGGAGGTSPGTQPPLTPPLRDVTSKVPISKPPAGYTVEGNFAYGPLTAQRLDVLYPSGGGPKASAALPAVLMFHGGAWIHSYTNNYGSGKDHMSTFFNRFLAHGFIVCNAEYRVNDATPDGAPAPAAVEDALLAAQWCWKYLDYFHGDRSKFVVTGASAGGHLALMVGLTTPSAQLGPTSPADFAIAGIVSGYGPADIEAEINAVAKGWLPADLPNRAAIAKQVNPITYVRADAPPLIVVQGANDNTAPVPDSQRLVKLLTGAGADASIHLVPGAGHGFDDTTWPDAERAMFDWLVAHGIGH